MYSEDDRLTPRERQVLELLCQGQTIKAIATRFKLSPRTVDVHRTSIYRTLGVHSIACLINRAIRRGLYDPSAVLQSD